MKKTRKAFTLVELLVVIAILAVLATVGIVGYTSFTKKAKESNDRTVISQLNLALQASETTDGKPKTMYEALKVVESAGFVVANLTPDSDGYDYVYDMKNNRFALLNKTTVVAEASDKSFVDGVTAWQFVDAGKPLSTSRSNYLKDGWTGDVPSTSTGLDCGNNTGITSVSYSHTGSAQDVVIRTNGGKLIIKDTNPDSHQYHYGSSSSVEVETGNNCYEVHAIVASLNVKAGKVIASTGSYIGLSEAANTGVTIVESEGVVVIPTNADTTKIPETIATQLGYTVSENKFVPSAEKADKSYFVINSANDLTDFVSRWNSGDEATSLIKSIKFASDVVYDYTVNPWTPLGTWDNPFNGTIDGMGCTIKGMGVINNVAGQGTSGSTSGISGEAYGLIGIAGGGDVTVTNIKFVDLTINHSSGNMVGAVIGFAPSNAKFQEKTKWNGNTTIGTHNVTITDITVSGSITALQDAAGIAGKLYNSGKQTIKNCTNNATITVTTTNEGYGRAAGIVAMASNTQTLLFESCVNKGSVTSIKFACGIVGYLSNMTGTITGCRNEGTLNGNSKYVNNIWSEVNKTGTVNLTVN